MVMNLGEIGEKWIMGGFGKGYGGMGTYGFDVKLKKIRVLT